MNLELRSIISKGNLAKERLTLRVKADLDLGDFLIAQSGYADGSPTINFYHTYWFPFKKVQKGDLVVIYTKKGKERSKALSTGKTAHFYYLDLDEAIWDDPSKAAIVLHAPIWESKPVDELS